MILYHSPCQPESASIEDPFNSLDSSFALNDTLESLRMGNGITMLFKFKKNFLKLMLVVLIIVTSFYVYEFLAIDGCLDGGGAWDYKTNKCIPN